MQISCERCGTTYALDERLIPSGGAPVQCTRCGHVFTAYPPGGGAATAAAPAPAPAARPQDAHRTQIFGSSGAPRPGPVPPAAAAPDRPSTQMFGAPAPAPAAPDPRNHTQMFGATTASDTLPGEPWAGLKPKAPHGAQQSQGTGGVRSAQMFAVASAPTVPVPSPFASSPSPAQAPARGKSGPELPQLFGAAAPPVAREPTQMFGTAAPPAPSGPKTQMFGSVPSMPPAAAPSPSTPPKPTQMFGAAGAVVPPADRAPTQLWTSHNPQPGSAPAPSPATPPKPAQMFGAVSAQVPAAVPAAQPKPPPSQTQMFGSVSMDVVPPTPNSTTQLYGLIPATPAPPPPSQVQAGVLPKILSSTPAPLPDESFADTVIRDRTRQPDPSSAARTQMFGAPDEGDLERAWQERQRSRFGVPDTTQPDAGPMQGRGDPTTIPEQPLEPAVTPLESPFVDGSQGNDTPLATRLPTPSDTPNSARLELPPETPELIPEPRTEESGAGVDEAVLLKRQMQRRVRIAAIAAGALLLVIVGGIVGRWVITRRNTVSADAIARLESARLLMRRDDGASRDRAISELNALITVYPDWVPAQADLVVALALQLDDARIQVRRLTAESDELNRRVSRLNEEKVPSDWQNRVTAMQARLNEIAGMVTPLNEKSGLIDTALNDRFLALQSAQPSGIDDQRVLVRAQAVYSGVKGSDTAISLAERYKNLGGTDGWAQVALAELALNARLTPEAMVAAHADMDELAQKDSTFLRSYVLSARLSLAQKHADSAVAGLEAVLALNPAHEVARQLLDWARSGEPER